ncbi:ribonuclease H II [Mycoplasmopsis californica]|uniref:Ribonuclease HII n=1 Tax=Mycoplasmopsis equigenitalium TaxID=114883 RepID=A0ABY5J303_9BACT|nr:ribonuclease HII [Mycoplasmopsis equigenitalium]UUD37158.1 ribonuclease HII [Mycoplasmopsis equigenitalium]VEU69536.1 ribonuclease H II [Mycoplasmopsis californica]
MLDYEKKYWNGNFNLICGVDEAGRGCCAGPLVAAAVIFPKDYQNNQINDSKQLSNKQRVLIFDKIIADALAYEVKFIPAVEVDRINPKNASKLAMKNAIMELNIKPDLIITDFEKIDINIKQDNLVKGDTKSISVAAASILAKVARDKYMIELDGKYPGYKFAKHKGYCTKEHNQAIAKYGVTPEHRKSYKNIKKALSLQN